jgi:Ca2+-binding RTX toxin-like protein
LFNNALNEINADNITDFNPVDDTIRLENAVFRKLMSAGALFYDADVNGAGAAVQVATLSVNLALTAADFVVF